MDDLLGHSITYRVAMGPRSGQKVFTLQTVPAQPPEEQRKGVAQAAGFSLHAGIGIEAEARGKPERLVRYVSRPAIADDRLALTAQGDVRLLAEASITSKLSKRIALSDAVTIAYERTPPDGVKRYDMQLRISVIVTF